MAISTHRLIQIHNLEDTCTSRARVLRRGAENLARIGNHKGEKYQIDRAARFESLSAKCQSRIRIGSSVAIENKTAKRPRATDPENTESAPECSVDCRYRQKYTGFALQRNALRCELASMVEPFRCGWNIKPGALGGRPLDYEPCIFLPAELEAVTR